eukprot:TRINITY_DN3987_c0_g4_i2.p1 TRINITY_DN3987_c0_g4~~TRINITY_DN3987_c0_g4_i2.p1  ORF type:complete len:387 (+),score=55.81 TRINITY_DN3987_c0_g4_i2:158-1318(+)
MQLYILLVCVSVLSQCVDDPDGTIAGSLGPDWCCVGCKNPLVTDKCGTMVNGVPLKDLCRKSCNNCASAVTAQPTAAPSTAAPPTPQPAGSGGGDVACTDDPNWLHTTGNWTCANLVTHKETCTNANQDPTCWSQACTEEVRQACASTCEACNTTVPLPAPTPGPSICTSVASECTTSPCTCTAGENESKTLISEACYRCTPAPPPSDSSPWWVSASVPFFICCIVVFILTVIIVAWRVRSNPNHHRQKLSDSPPGGSDDAPKPFSSPYHAPLPAHAGETPKSQELKELHEKREVLKQQLEQRRMGSGSPAQASHAPSGTVQAFPDNTHVEANWNGTWCDAVILGHLPEDGTYMIRWLEDNTETAGVVVADLRAPNKNPIPALFNS